MNTGTNGKYAVSLLTAAATLAMFPGAPTVRFWSPNGGYLVPRPRKRGYKAWRKRRRKGGA